MHDEENYALASKEKKGKEKVSLSKCSSSNDGKKVDQSKVRCFCFHEVGHCVANCPQRKSKKGSGEGFEGEALASQFELISHSSHAWFHPCWEVVGFLIVEPLST